MMKKKIVKYLVFIGIFLVSSLVKAQQTPQYTNYMYNMSVMNPAYATDTPDVVNFGGFYRTQWVGAVGAPKTASLFAHVPLNEKIQMGLTFQNDDIGDVVSENNINLNFAYILPVSEKNYLSFGLSGGFNTYDVNFSGFQYTDPNFDPAFANNINETFPSMGLGLFYYSDNYYLGLSTPNLLSKQTFEQQNGIYVEGIDAIHYYFTGGYVFDLKPNLKFKPAFMAKATEGAPISFDLTANVLINNLIEIGAAYRFDDSVSGLINFNVTPTLRIGYSYDYTLSNLGNYNSGSHEIFLLFNLDKSSLSSKGYEKSPRFF
ncbi:MAG TPA: type IX secretion system membrane protein PorP/SprF [Flavobacterium sp.]|nr:type IX secretion system membrane protein PorP/SprF [Flavobacterium sp.]